MQTSYNIADTFISGGDGPKDDPNRWYLCVEQGFPMNWVCTQTTKYDALHSPHIKIGVRTMAIPISKYSPPILDKYLLAAKMTPTVKISESTQS